MYWVLTSSFGVVKYEPPSDSIETLPQAEIKKQSVNTDNLNIVFSVILENNFCQFIIHDSIFLLIIGLNRNLLNM